MAVKEYDYIITLKHPDFKWTNKVSLILCLLSALLFTYSIIQTAARGINRDTLVYSIALAVVIVQISVTYIKKEIHAASWRLAFFVIAIAWILTGSVWLGGLYIFAAVVESQIKFPEEIAFNSEGIIRNSFIKKTYSWSELNNVVLKDDILTMDFHNNSLLQKETSERIDPAIEEEFNVFCRQQLTVG